MEKLKTELKTEALKHDLCTSWQQMMDDAKDKETLVRMYLRGIDFCIGNDYPSEDYIQKHFKGFQALGIFVNEPVFARDLPKLVAVGGCTGIASYSDYSVSRVFVKHRSFINIHAEGFARVTLDCFDKSITNIHAEGKSVVTVYRYLGAVVNLMDCAGTAKVKIIDKNTRTY